MVYFSPMISDTDITKLKKVFATKEELADVKLELGEVRDELGEMHTTVNEINIKLDKIAGGIEDLRLENRAGAAHLARHDRQIEALSKGTGVTIPN
jgi:septal ring factor EnvC (AmiA/AmiB activator)